jgi:transcriptional regulator with XRE-family HTH domain
MDKFKERFLELMKVNNVESYVRLSKATGIPVSTMSHWLNDGKRPNVDNLIALSIYFGMSIDYIVGQEDDFYEGLNESKQFSQMEREVFLRFRKLPLDCKKLVIAYMDGLLAKSE